MVIEPNVAQRSILVEALVDYDVVVAADAKEAILVANENDIELVVMDLSLGGHSGLEFLYEFRTYTDWQQIPVVVYSSIKLADEVLNSRAWEQLNVVAYLYKPQSSLRELTKTIADIVSQRVTAKQRSVSLPPS